MTGRAIIYYTLASPIFHPFTVSASNPIAFLPEMTFTAELIAVVEVDLQSFFADKIVLFLFIVAISTGQSILFLAVIDFDIIMGKK